MNFYQQLYTHTRTFLYVYTTPPALDLFGNPLPTSANKGTNNPQIVSHGDNNNNNNSIDNNNRSMNDVFIGWKRFFSM
jgi:hypothetical protein